MEPVVTLCTGHRCAALLGQAAADTLPCLKASVRASQDAVLVTTDCVGACAQAPVLALSERRGGRPGLELLHTRWLGPVGRDQVDAVCAWLDEPLLDRLPAVVADAVFQQAQP